jgi:peroxiredoxin
MNMKKLSIIVLGLCTLFAFRPKPGFHLTGTITGGIEGMKIYLRYADVTGAKPLDSVVLHKGRFTFAGNMPSPRYCSILFKDTSTRKDRYMEDKVIELFVENSDISVTAPYDSLHIEYDKYVSGVQTDAIVVKGSESNALYMQYYWPAAERRKESSDLFTQYIKFLNPDSGQARQPRATGMALTARIDVSDSLRKAYMLGFIKDHPIGPVTAYLASNALNYGNTTVTDVEELRAHFEAGKDKDFLVSKFLTDAAEMKKTVVGSSLIDVTLKDTAGVSHALSDYVGKGKYVLVECWASWCHPCRADIPHLKEVYDLYHPYGFEIVSVSLDEKRDNWTKAIGQEKMPWLQLSDLKDFNGPLPKDYHINGIPHCLLFDPEGKLVTVNMRGSWMDRRLMTMYGDHFPAEGMAHVSAHIPGLADGPVYITYRGDSAAVQDSVAAVGGQFTWEARLPAPQLVAIMFARQYHRVFVESGDIRISSTDTGSTIQVEGSKTQEESDAYQASIKDLDDREQALYPKWGKGSREEQASLESELETIGKQKEERADAFIKAHPGSAFSVNLIAERSMMGDYETVSNGYALLSAEGQQTAQGQRIAKRLEVLKRSVMGQTAIDFTQNDTTGKPVRFEAFKGKYVLLDFWASWCGPCRAENPNVLKAFSEYKSKNFTVVGVSLDQDGKYWKKAIRDDKMPWAQLSDLKGGQNEVATYYGIMAIPSNLLIDPSGKIVARNLRGEALHARLAEILQ